ncbi:MAG: hypothetical protein MUP11_06100, partial [Anaerolineales bacterium]|nr:hypothetical protein [Anaerolineales bacterium]
LLHFVLLLIMVVTFPWIKSLRTKNDLLFPVILLSSVLIYSVTIKWQPWGSRLQLPIFLIGAPVIGFVTDKRKISNLLQWLFVLSFVLYSVPYLTLNSSRPLIPLFQKSSPFRVNTIKRFFSDHPNLYDEYSEIISPFYTESSILRTDRVKQYFSNNISNFEDYLKVMQVVNELNPNLVGLDLGSNDWEYPIWVLSGRHASRGFPEFIHIEVEDDSKNLENPSDQLPEYIITTRWDGSRFIEELDYQYLVDTTTIDLLAR